MAQQGNPLAADFNYQPFYKSMEQTGRQQSAFNSPTTFSPWSTQTVNADGSSSMGFTGAFGALNDNLTNQAAQSASTPLDFGQFGVGDGSDAGKQAAQAYFGQARSRLDPAWEKNEHRMRTSLYQGGMGDSSAGDSTREEFGRDRNDAYSSAMAEALRTGMSAQQSAFQGNLSSRQNDVANILRGKQQPLQELGQLSGFLGQPQYNQDNSAMVAAAQNNQQADARAIEDNETLLRQALKADGWTDEHLNGKNYEQMVALGAIRLGGGLSSAEQVMEWARKKSGSKLAQ